MLLSYRDIPGGTAPLPKPVPDPLKLLTLMARLPNLPWLHFLLQVPVTSSLNVSITSAKRDVDLRAKPLAGGEAQARKLYP